MVLKFEHFFPFVNENRKIHLYLPDDYYQEEEKYPVIYFFDGNNLFFDGDSIWGMSLQMEWYLKNYDKKFIVVGIEQPKDPYQRVKEHCPYKIYSHTFGDIDGNGDALIKWIINDLKPFIDSNYRTLPFRETTQLAGCSSAGVTSLYGAIKYNNYFSKTALISPYIVDTKYVLIHDIYHEDINPDTKIFFSYGTNEYGNDFGMRSLCINNMYEVEYHLHSRNVKTYMFKNENGEHNEISWRNEIFTWLDFLWK